MATITQDVTLIFDADNNVTRVQDNTVWPSVSGSGQDYKVLLGMKGIGSLVSPSGGVVFSATNPLTPLIDLADGATSSIDYNLPTANGGITNGTYPFTYSAVGDYEEVNMTLEVVDASGFIALDDNNVAAIVLQAGDTITISDNSSNPDANGIWTVTSVEAVASSSFSKIFLSGFSIVDGSPTGKVSYSINRVFTTNVTATYTGCTKVTPVITFTSQPYTGEFGTLIVADSTDYSGVTLTDNSITVKYPDGLVPAPSVDPLIGNDVLSVTITEVGTGTYTITLDGTITQEVATGFEVTYTVAGIRVKGRPVNVFERVVVWRDGLCCLTDCLNVVFERHNRFVLAGQESPFTAVVADLALAVNLYLIAIQCGVQEDIESSYTAITNILQTADCACDCGCGTTNNPVWISNSSLVGENLITALQDEIDALTATVETLTIVVDSKVASVTGALVDNTDPQNPVVSLELNEDQFSGTGGNASPLNIIGIDADLVNITPPILGLTATNGQAAFSELKSKTGIAQLTANNAQNTATAAMSASETNTDDIVALTAVVADKVASVTGALVDNTDPQNPIINQTYFDEDQFTGNGVEYPIFLSSLAASNVFINPAISGLTATNAQDAFAEFQTSKLETVAVDGTTITGDGTVGNPLVAAGGGSDVPTYACLFVQDGSPSSAPVITQFKNTLSGTPFFSRLSAGYFNCLLAGAFPDTRTFITHSVRFMGTVTPPYIVYAYPSGGPSGGNIAIKVKVWNGTDWAQADASVQIFFKIEVYPA